MSEAEHVTLAREAQAAGLTVTRLTPAALGDRYDIQLWQPDGALWVEGCMSAAAVRARIAHWPAHRHAGAEQSRLRLVIPGDGQVRTCGCIDDTDTTEESK